MIVEDKLIMKQDLSSERAVHVFRRHAHEP